MNGPDRVEDRDRAAPLTVVYLLGFARSGTTILGNLLDQLDGWFHVGERHYLWTEGLPFPRKLCGCRLPITECEVWQTAMASAYPETGHGDPPVDLADAPTIGHAFRPATAERLSGVHRDVMSWRRVVRDARPGRRDAAVEEYAASVGALYRGLADATGARFLVDSSKLAFDASIIKRVPGITLKFVHIVRDPRGTVLSRFKFAAEQRADGTYVLPTAGVAREAARWLSANASAEAVARLGGRPLLRLRYEDLFDDPAKGIGAIAAFAGDRDVDLGFIHGNEVDLTPNHTTGGNRNRWEYGRTDLRIDRTWVTGYRPLDRSVVTLVALPGLLRYGYRLSGRTRRTPVRSP